MYQSTHRASHRSGSGRQRKKISQRPTRTTPGRTDKAITIYEEMYRADRENAAVAHELAKIYYGKMICSSQKNMPAMQQKGSANPWMSAF